MNGKIVVAAVAAALAAAPAAAQERIDQHLATGGSGVVEINNVAGSVRVVGWSRNEVRVTGTIEEGVERVELREEAGRVVVRVILPRRGNHDGDAELEVHVPAGKDVDVHTVSADAVVEELEGRADVQTVSGEVHVSGRPKEAQLRTVSGDVVIDGVRGRVEIQTVSGDVRMDGRGIEAQVRTVSGDVRVDGQLDPGGTNQVNTHSGDVTFTLPRGGGAQVEFGSFSGEVSSTIPGGMRMQGSSRSQHLEVGSGGPRIVVHTFSGDLHLREI
ncbi:MAG TPA: DUF4097 family beta strand repeat-containing protein [Longimicrobiaceae bacterium]|nr:DUF4097 family beta strand repeat-containing protein [Longimicrobiaceae bacterium]